MNRERCMDSEKRKVGDSTEKDRRAKRVKGGRAKRIQIQIQGFFIE